MVVVPALLAVTTPLEDTVATPVLEDVHGFVAAGVPLPLRSVVLPSHTLNVPLMVGAASTVRVAVAVHPSLFV